MLWGFSEALDFFEEYQKHVEKVKNGDGAPAAAEVNILLFGSCDPRHIIKSMAKVYRHRTKLNFFVLEGCSAMLARQILLMSIALEPSHLLTLPSRVHLFMDVYGNSLLRSTSIGYIESKVMHLTKCVTDLEFNAQMQPIFNLSKLKFVERDLIENALSFWREKESNQYDISGCWKRRVRQHLLERFDSRYGIYDWDHQMRLKDNGAHQICSQEYKHWRETGVAFTFPEYRQSHANKTFAMQPTVKPNAGGYLGDIAIGPFCAFGLACSDSSLLKSNHGQNEYRATDITERNLFELFYEIQECKPPTPDVFSPMHRLGMTKIDTGKIFALTSTECDGKDFKKFHEPLIPMEQQVQVTFLSTMSDAQPLIEGTKFSKFFDIVFVGRNYFPMIKKDFSKSFATNALVMFETAQLSAQRTPEISEFLEKIRDMAKEMELKAVSNFNINLPLQVARFSNADLLKDEEETEIN